MPARKKIVLLVVGWLCSAASLFFFWLFYSEYWVYRHLFMQGRYFDAEQMVVHQDEAAFYLAPAIFFLFASAFIFMRKRA